jgi:hypothetical protein
MEIFSSQGAPPIDFFGPKWHSRKFATGVNNASRKIAAGFNDTSGKFATGVMYTSRMVEIIKLLTT